MKNEFSISTETVGRVRGVLSSLGILCAAVTVLVFSTLFFSDVSFGLALTLELTLDFALLYFASYIMFSSLFETGMEKAECGEAFQALHARRAALFERFRSEGNCESIFLYCRAVSEKETAELRRDILFDCLMTEEELATAQKKDIRMRTRLEHRAVFRMEKANAVRITPQMLLAEKPGARRTPTLAHPPEELRRRRSLHFLIPTALTALFSASLVFSVAKDPSLDIVVGYVFKLFTLFWSGVKGFRSGYAHADTEKTEYMREQCFRLEEYFALQAGRAEAKTACTPNDTQDTAPV